MTNMLNKEAHQRRRAVVTLLGEAAVEGNSVFSSDEIGEHLVKVLEDNGLTIVFLRAGEPPFRFPNPRLGPKSVLPP